ncbi:hypothetical protein BAL199_21529 [alpha proteobacterium BAL199]|nr:hypothetical protein BAL199_21529 [alpha proteobacterium BAL199]
MLLVMASMLGGCAVTNRIETPDEGALVSPHHGVLIVGFERPDDLSSEPFALDVTAVDSAGRAGPVRANPYVPRSASALLPIQQFFQRDSGSRLAFALEPGDYVLAAVRTVRKARYSDQSPVFGGGLGGALLEGAATGLFVGGIEALLATSQVDRAAGRPPLQYVTNGVAAPEAPRFRVRAGEVLYIGDILVGAETRRYEVDDPARRSGPNAFDTAYTATTQDIRLFAEYAVDEAGARRDAAALRLNHRPFRAERLRLSGDARTMFVNYRPVDSRTFHPIGQPQISRARPDMPRAAEGSPSSVRAAPVAPTSAITEPDLMERFLSGAISKEKYDQERARLAAGS